MDYTQLIKRLTQGELKAIIGDENEVKGYETLPPNRDALMAAKVIRKLSAQLQQDMQYIATLTQERDEYLDQLTKLQTEASKEIENADNT